MQSEIELAEVMKTIIVENKDEITLLEVVQKAVPRLDEDSIKKFFGFIVNGKKVDDWSTKVSQDDKVEVLPIFAGGSN
jgi:molybdopterin converting factor small subunit